MSQILGRAENGLLEYALVLLMYGLFFIVMRYANRNVELNFRKTFWVLYFGWSVLVFIGNFLFYTWGFMSFLPWVNNFLHTFVWIGFCLGFLYAGCHERPLWEQFVLFMVFSLVVKAFEHDLLGTWELDHFFWFHGNHAYIVGWSMMDGLYPVISSAVLHLLSKFIDGIAVP